MRTVLGFLRVAGFLGLLTSGVFVIPEMSLAIPSVEQCDANPDMCARAFGGGHSQPSQPASPPATPPQAGAPPGLPAEVWLADLAITLTGNKDLRNQSIIYQVTVTNLGDDDGRDISFSLAFSHSLPAGLRILKMNSSQAKCQMYEPVAGLPYVKCIQPALGVRGISRVDVLVANPGNGPRKATAQVMGIVPDYTGTNNTMTLITP